MFSIASVLLTVRRRVGDVLYAHCDAAPGPNHWDSNWDLKGDTTPKGIRQVVLVRHGQYTVGVKGDENKVLTELGKRQAARTGERLGELIRAGVIYPVRTVRYSTMARATETFKLILPHLPPMAEHQLQPCSMIREGAVCRPDPPSLYWKPSDEDFVKEGLRVEAAFRNYVHRAVDKPARKPHHSSSDGSAGGSSITEGVAGKGSGAAAGNSAISPAVGGEDTVAHSYSDIFVCHGNVIRYFVMRGLQLPPEAWLRLAVSNASITVLYIYPSGRVSLYNLGEVGHLSPEMITYN